MRIPHNDPLGSDSPDAAPERPSKSGSASVDPERKCVLSGDHGTRDSLIRLAISPDGLVLPDVFAKAPGRGAWIGVSRAELEKAQAKGQLKGALARAYGKVLGGATLTIPDDLGAKIEAALLRAATERLGLELRAGKLLLGSDRIAEQARSGKVKWLGHAADASEDGSRKLDQAWRVGEDAEGTGKAGTRLPLDRDTLSVALGRDNVVHLALNDDAAAQRFSALLQRLLHFLGRDDTAADDTGASMGNPSAATTH